MQNGTGPERGRARERQGEREKGLIRLELGRGGAGESLGRGQASGRGWSGMRETSLVEAAKSLGKGLMHTICFCLGRLWWPPVQCGVRRENLPGWCGELGRRLRSEEQARRVHEAPCSAGLDQRTDWSIEAQPATNTAGIPPNAHLDTGQDH